MPVSLYGANGVLRHTFERRANPRSCFQGGRHAGSTSHSDRGSRLDWRYVRRSRRCPLRGESCGIYKGHSEGSYGEVDVPEQRATGRPSGSGPTSTSRTKYAEGMAIYDCSVCTVGRLSPLSTCEFLEPTGSFGHPPAATEGVKTTTKQCRLFGYLISP